MLKNPTNLKNKVYVYVFDTMSDWEISYITPEIQSGRYFKNDQVKLEIVTISNKRNKIVTMGGLKIYPDQTIDEFNFDDAKLIILPGGETWNDSMHDPILKLADKCLESKITVASICGSTIGLANKGLLNDRLHTSNNLEYLKMVSSQYKGEKNYKKSFAVTDGYLITASGLAPVEFSVEVLKKLDVFKPEVLNAWELLYKTKEDRYFFEIMEQLK